MPALWITASKRPSLLTWSATVLAPAMVERSPSHGSLGTGCHRKGVATSIVIAPMQDDLMTLLDQESGRHET
jgi:hypothetical protein